MTARTSALRPQAALNKVAAAVAVALLAGCSYNIRHVENPVTMPTAWDAEVAPGADAIIATDWWTEFNSPVLNGLIEIALRDNPGLIATEERLKQAERNFARNRDDLFPELSLSARTSRTEAGGNQVPETTTDSTSVGLSTSYSFDLFGAQAATYRSQVASFIGTRYDAELARITLSANVARAYFNLLGIRSQVNVARENLAIAEELLRIVDARYRNGVVRQYDLRQQTTSVLQQRTNLIPLENQMRQAETTLGLLLGISPQDFRIAGEPIDALEVPEVAPWAPSELLLRRPDIAAAELALVSVSANLDAARARLIPVSLTLNASGNTGSQELFSLTDARTYSIGGALAIAEGIFSFRQRRTNILNAESNEYIALINYAQTIRSALKEIDDTLATATANQRAEESQRATLTQAQLALDLAELEYREGSASLQQVLDSQRSLFSAQEAMSRSRLQRLNTAVSLYVALGGGWTAPDNLSP